MADLKLKISISGPLENSILGKEISWHLKKLGYGVTFLDGGTEYPMDLSSPFQNGEIDQCDRDVLVETI
ncbi:MAG: hypothetical protein HOI47_19635 [Candidatus Scalindua sp.]|mgnify:CR=1|jgi:hypothetical protein|nr:hypothetical protein [Candidatus Scalindua sp.]MBT6228860.1 hypothetical protein [Candidatus Scalindua sp.]